jgi:hypothetical protein
LLLEIWWHPGFEYFYGLFEWLATCMDVEGEDSVLLSAVALNTILEDTELRAKFATLNLKVMLNECLKNIQDAIGMSLLHFPNTQELIDDAGLAVNTLSKLNHARLIMARYLRDVAHHLSAYAPA